MAESIAESMSSSIRRTPVSTMPPLFTRSCVSDGRLASGHDRIRGWSPHDLTYHPTLPPSLLPLPVSHSHSSPPCVPPPSSLPSPLTLSRLMQPESSSLRSSSSSSPLLHCFCSSLPRQHFARVESACARILRGNLCRCVGRFGLRVPSLGRGPIRMATMAEPTPAFFPD